MSGRILRPVRVALLAVAALVPTAVLADDSDRGLARALADRDLDAIRAWSERPDADDADRWNVRIELARIEGSSDAALLVERARSAYPEDPGLLLQQARIELDALDPSDGRFTRMREARAIGRRIDRALELAPDHPEALVAAIEYHREVPRIAGGREERVGPLIERLQAVEPARAAWLEARSLRRDGDPEAALARIDEAIEQDPLARPAWRVERAAILGNAGQTAAAVEALEALLRAHPDFGPGWYELGRQVERSGAAPERGIEALERYLLMRPWPGDPSTAEALIHLASLKTRAGDAEAAQRALDQARILDPGLFSGADGNGAR